MDLILRSASSSSLFFGQHGGFYIGINFLLQAHGKMNLVKRGIVKFELRN
jgi:hypothetical protein